MKKINIIIIIAIVIAVFCGCGTVKINCSIDDTNNASMTITAEIPKDDLSSMESESISSFLGNSELYWKNTLGYDVDCSESDNQYSISLKKEEQCDSKEEAVYALLEMMGSDASPFINVEGGYNESYFNNYYNIAAKVDLSGIMDYEFIDTLDESDKDYIADKVSNFSGTVSFVLDGDITEHTGQLDGQTITADLSLDEVSELYALVELPNAENQAEYDAMKEELIQSEETVQKYTKLFYAAIASFSLLAIVLVVLLVIRKISSKKKSDKNNDESLVDEKIESE